MKLSLQVNFCFFFLALIFYYPIFPDAPGFDYNAFAMMQNPAAAKDLSVGDIFLGGAKGGAMRSVSDAINTSLSKTLVSSVSKGQGVLRSWYKSLVNRMHGVQGFEVKELFGWKWVLERSINTHISNVAKGARVVRAHVLEQQDAERKVKAEKPYGIVVLKQDIEYIIADLKARGSYYALDNGKKARRKGVDQILDWAAAGGASYLGISWLLSGPTESQLKEKRLRCLGEARKHYDVLNKINSSPLLVAGDKDLPASVQEQIIALRLQQARDEREYAGSSILGLIGVEQEMCSENVDAVKDITAQLTSRVHADVSKKARIVKWVAKGAIGLFVLSRAIHWARSENAVAFVDNLSDVNRTMVVHLNETLIKYLEYLSQLCDQVNEECDIARLKDEFEFIAKNCSETLAHIARIVDQEAANVLQRLGKPGQAIAGFGQGAGGLGGGLPRG